ncbi:GNAT family N-acetyltransferase [Chromohalobacter nigrandesensis]|uniref:GNAT family N-acetyltransferase n=1 Tax=Chromohalobacter nigrandesensis TaxID=119863 RepID=UPI001FF22927|nr:GNAT family N-acetyltransferase [Chromohalobacter nigrandesensis]MCK0746804.1 GNAT family N-acetyltransferase [Chromohalobacter nigrandesensis]
MKIRKMSQADLMDISRIQRECYSEDLLESIDSYSAKLSANSDFSFIAVQNEMAVGYVVALPWIYGEMLDLDGVDYSIPVDADSLCIHDIAVSRNARNAGAAKYLLNAVFESAKSRGYRQFFLVAVQGASSYWKRQGFEVVQVNEKLKHHLLAYGEDAEYMTRTYE